MRNKEIKLKYAIIVWLLVFIISIGTTFALNVWTSGNTTLAGNTMCFDIKYNKGQDINFGTVNSSGVVENGMEAAVQFDPSKSAYTYVNFSRQNGCLLYGKGTITANISTSVNLSTGALKYKIVNNATSSEVASGSITNTGDNIIYNNFDIIDSITYVIYFWLDSNYIDNTYLEASFSGTVEASAVSTKEYGEINESSSLYDIIKLNASLDNTFSMYVTSSSGIDFSQISSDTNGKGVYELASTKDDEYPIYYYRGAVDNNNVLFANFCWKIVRTTETGGIKLIYNGTQKEEYESILTLTQDEYTNITNDATYPYTYDTDTNKWTSTNKTDGATGTIEFSVSTAGTYYLEYTVSSEASYDYAVFYLDGEQIGEFSGEESGTISLGAIDSNNVIKVEYSKDSSYYEGNDNVVFSVGQGVGEPILTCNNTGTDSQLSSTKAFNSSSDSSAYVGYMYGTVYTRGIKSMSGVTNTYYYGNSVTYADGTYTLTDTITSSSWSSIYLRGLNSNHYTCFSTGNSCSSVYYIYSTDYYNAYYITLTGGKTVEDALSEMLDYNTTSSTIKGNNTTEGTIDYWYYTNIDQKGYGSYVEDTIWCNDRSIYSKGGWEPNGGIAYTNEMHFGARGRLYTNKAPSLTCTRDIDKFTVSTDNGNGALTYPVGLLTADEIAYAGGVVWTENTSYYLCTGEYWWTGSPETFGNTGIAFEWYVYPDGSLDSDFDVGATRGVRPSLSLVPGTQILSGSGTVTDPYVVN